MKVAINQRPYEGPWGGGNRFVKSLTEGLVSAGHHVVYDLSRPVDIILIFETRVRSPNVCFGAGAVLRYLLRFPDTLVVQRINECDERKGGEKFITDRLLRANYAADLTVFVGSWLMDLPAWKNHDRSRCHVILNGADTEVFNAAGGATWNSVEPMKLVTHHWGAHPYKGFDVYCKIDALLDDPSFAQDFSMSYIGNLAKGVTFKNIRHIKPLDGLALAAALKEHHTYLTGSINEPGGNHQNEGACCGLPLVYRDSGCLPEYCTGFGIAYKGPDDVREALLKMRQDYALYRGKIKDYPHSAVRTVAHWITYFEESLLRRSDIVRARRLWRSPLTFMLNQIPW